MRPKFDGREWVNDIAVTTVAGLLGGGVTVLLVPDVDAGSTIANAGILGLIAGVVTLPLKWVLNWRPRDDDDDDNDDDQASRS